MMSPGALLSLYAALMLVALAACFVLVRRSPRFVRALIILGGASIPVGLAYLFGAYMTSRAPGADTIAGDVAAVFWGLPGAFAWLATGALAWATRTSKRSAKTPP